MSNQSHEASLIYAVGRVHQFVRREMGAGACPVERDARFRRADIFLRCVAKGVRHGRVVPSARARDNGAWTPTRSAC